MDFTKLLSNIFNNNENKQLNPQPPEENPIPQAPVPFSMKDKAAAISDLTGEWVFDFNQQPFALIFMPSTLSIISKETRKDLAIKFNDMLFYNSYYWTISFNTSEPQQTIYTFIRRYEKFYFLYKNQEILLQQFNSY